MPIARDEEIIKAIPVKDFEENKYPYLLYKEWHGEKKPN